MEDLTVDIENALEKCGSDAKQVSFLRQFFASCRFPINFQFFFFVKFLFCVAQRLKAKTKFFEDADREQVTV